MKKAFIGFLLPAALLVLAACSGGKSTDRTLSAERDHVMVVALQSDGKSLDPHTVNDAASMRLIENMYSTLLRYAEDYGEVEADLAGTWSVSDDRKTYRLTLRTNAYFHVTGRNVKAEDVIYSINRIRSTGTRASHFEKVASITPVGPFEIAITLEEPFAPFLTYLAHPMNAVVDRAVVEESGLDRADGGSGPFSFVEWKKDRHLILEASPNYYLEGRPYLKRVVFRPIPDETARTTALRNREVDIILDVAAKDVSVLEQAHGMVVETVPGTFWEYIGLNCSREPFDDIRVRKAVAHTVDRALVNQLVKFGRATPLTGGHIPPGHWAYADLDIYDSPDLDKARRLLDEAGYGDGFSVTLQVGSEFDYQVKAAEVIKQQLREVGIDVRVQALESGVFFNNLGSHDFDMCVVGWLGFVDPDEWTYNLFRTDAVWNQQQYSNDEMDALLEKGRRLFAQEDRYAVYRKIQERAARDAPMVFLYANNRTAAYLPSVAGFDVHPAVTTISLRDTRRERAPE